jgi:Leucine-rich repeat (LRR) protein
MSRTLIILLTGFLISACADYRYTINDNVVYTPDPLFADYELADAGLERCVQQYIGDNAITAAAQLEELNCSHAGITSLAGLQVFNGLQRLKLSTNTIADVAPLADMEQLIELRIDDNALIDLNPLRGLPLLSYLDVRGNKQLRCSTLALLEQMPEIKVEPPKHCQT